MTNKKLWQMAATNALFTAVYVAFVSVLMTYGQRIFGNANNLLGGIAILMLFALSAAVCGVLILGRPLTLYLDGAKKEAVRTLIYTLVVLLLIILSVMVILTIIK